MPSLQFSVAPWDFDDNTEIIEIARNYTKLHFDYSELIMARFHLAVESGHPGKLCVEHGSALIL